jgi:hypothetical protein
MSRIEESINLKNREKIESAESLIDEATRL